jgi:hypothetical protein
VAAGGALRRLYSLAAAAALGGGAAALAAQSAPAPAGPGEASAPGASGAVIGTITIQPQTIFDLSIPEENRRLFRLANRLHRTTRPSVVRDQLLFREGDPYDARLLAESERRLRELRFLYDATVEPVVRDERQIDVGVTTRDVWTLVVWGGFSRAGGENSLYFELQDTNFLGLGKDLTFERRKTVDRITSLLRYRDPALLGSRLRLEAWNSEATDGFDRRLSLEKPFESLAARRGAGLRLSTCDRHAPLYEQGEVEARFGHRRDAYELWGGRSAGLASGRSLRWLAGLTYERDRFSPLAGETAPARFPAGRTLAYPWVGFERVADDFREVHDLDQIHRTEDLRVGWRVIGRLGWSSPAWGGDRELAIAAAEVAGGWTPRPAHLLLATGRVAGRWGGAGAQDLRFGGSLRYDWRNWGRHLLHVALSGDLVEAPDLETQLLLGGDNGLRGYPLRYRDGDRRLLLIVEQRLFTDRHLLRLAYLGGAVFVDAGRSWFAGRGDGSPQGWLRDVGVGLRLHSSRSGLGTMLHLDVAVPLDRDGGIESVQWLVRTAETF